MYLVKLNFRFHPQFTVQELRENSICLRHGEKQQNKKQVKTDFQVFLLKADENMRGFDNNIAETDGKFVSFTLQ